MISRRTVAITGLALGAAVGFAYAMRQRDGRLADRDGELTTDEVALKLGTDLALADGGYDASAVASPTTIDLR